MMRESIVIRNFGPVKNLEIDQIKPLTVFIGESGSGKSAIMKVVALFRWLYKMTNLRSYMKSSGVSKSPFRFKFDSYLKNGLSEYMCKDTFFEYRNGSCTIKYEKGKLTGTNYIIPQNELSLEKIVFISDRRNVIPDIFEHQMKGQDGMFYLNETYQEYLLATSAIREMPFQSLNVKFEVKKTPAGSKHYITSMNPDNPFSINLRSASSGIQNIVPLSLIVEYFSTKFDLIKSMNESIFSYVAKGDNLKSFKAETNIGEFPVKNVSIFIEEPELSLFPDTQLSLMDFLINRCFVLKKANYSESLMIATHSPYIVNYLNVLMKRKPSDSDDAAFISSDDVAAYLVYNGTLQNLMQEDSQNNHRIVDSQDLSEPMVEMMTEYKSL